MNRTIKSCICLITALTVALCLPFPSMAAVSRSTGTAVSKGTSMAAENKSAAAPDIDAELTEAGRAAADYLMKEVPEPECSSVGGEWTLTGLALWSEGVNGRKTGKASDKHRDESLKGYFEKYYDNLEETVRECRGVLTEDSYTEYSRVVIALSAVGESALDVAGYNLVEPLRDYESVTVQGLNGAIYALMALDKGGYVGPRREYRNYILQKELPGGGWSFMGKGEADIDMTAMAVQALSKYRLFKDMSPVIERAMPILKDAEYDSSETVSQVIIALDELGMEPGEELKGQLLKFRLTDGSFRHSMDEGEGNIMSTEQALMALSTF